jgi:uncharacterized membrane protein required for colicin V production
MHVVAILATLIIIGFMAFDGFRSGLFRATYALVRHLLAFLAAMTFAVPVAGLILSLVPNFSTHPGPQYVRVIAVAIIFGVVVGAARYLRNRFTAADISALDLPDKIGGSILGLLNGVVLSGFVLILWTMMPFAKYVPGDYGRIRTTSLPFDTGAVMLRFYNYSAGRMGGSRMFLLHSEPVQQDANADGVPDAGPGVGFEDLNGNGEWDRGWLTRYRNHADFRVEDVEKAQTTVERQY